MTGRTKCLNWARPDLREPQGVTPGATRPHSHVAPCSSGTRGSRCALRRRTGDKMLRDVPLFPDSPLLRYACDTTHQYHLVK